MRRTIFLLLLFVLSVALSCATVTQPNTSALYRMPALKSQLLPLPEKPKLTQEPLPTAVQALFEKLYGLDPILALEAGRLPEFQGKVDEKQILALNRFVNIISNTSSEEKSNLTKLLNVVLKVGKPDIRRYSTPLQAVFWVLEKNEYDPEENFLRCNWLLPRMCLNDLVGRAWDFSEKDRWKDYNTVAERLNAPELVDYYEKARFIYVSRRDPVAQPFVLFKTNGGHCSDVTAFTVDCLRKGGYKVWEYRVQSPTGLYPYHMVTLFEMDGREYIMDNGRPDKRGIVPRERYSPF